MKDRENRMDYYGDTEDDTAGWLCGFMLAARKTFIPHNRIMMAAAGHGCTTPFDRSGYRYSPQLHAHQNK